MILVGFLTLASAASADDYPSIVANAFANLDAGYRDRWAFSETATEEGVTVVGRYDPRLPVGSRWALISVDGRQPTAEELEDYLEEKEDDQGNERNDDNDASDFVDIESLELLEETDRYWLFDFTPNLDDEDDEARGFMDQVTGTLKVAKDGPYVQSLELRNEKPIKPAFSVKITRFFTRLTFGPAATGGPVVPKTMDVQVRGRAAALIRFDEAESIHYSDYEFAGS
jgi:hypothetical protein